MPSPSAVQTPPLPAADHPLRDPMLWDVTLKTVHGDVIMQGNAAQLGMASPNYLWPALRWAKQQGNTLSSLVVVIGDEHLDAQLARNLLVWSTQCVSNQEKTDWLHRMLPRPPAPGDAEAWTLLINYLEAAQTLQLAEAATRLRAHALRPAARELLQSQGWESLHWRKSSQVISTPYVLSQQEMEQLPPVLPCCRRLEALGMDVRDSKNGLFVMRVHRRLWETERIQCGMVLQHVAETSVVEGTLEEKLARARGALPPLVARASTLFMRRRVRLALQKRVYRRLAWKPSAPALRAVTRCLRDMRMDRELQVVGEELLQWRRLFLPGLLRSGETHADGINMTPGGRKRAREGLDALLREDPALKLLKVSCEMLALQPPQEE